MTCYHPRLRITNTSKWETAIDGHKYHPAIIEQPDDIHQRIDELSTLGKYEYRTIPCRNCIGCRLENSRQWANRGYLESKYHDECYFITLTYHDDYLTINDEITTSKGITYTNNGEWLPDLQPQHFEKFVHNMRQIAQRETNQKKIKYLGCGEYGTKNGRPHYHLIMWMHIPVETMYNPRLIEKHFYYQNKWIERSWKYGISNVTEANWNTIAYVARYITKKINGKESEDLYAQNGIRKEFFRASKGIGKQYYTDNRDEIYKTDSITVKNGDNSAITTSVPKYFDYLERKRDEEAFKTIQRKRSKKAKNAMKNKLSKTSLKPLEQLTIEEHSQGERAKALKRRYETGDHIY